MLVADRILTLDADGFTVGTRASVNLAGVKYYWTALLEAPSHVKIGSYTGSGIDNRTIATGFQPGYAITVPSLDKPSFQRFSGEVSDASLSLEGGGESGDRIQTFVASGFQIGASSDVNSTGATYYYAAWNAAAPRARAGIYLGNDTDNRDIVEPGFRPGLALGEAARQRNDDLPHPRGHGRPRPAGHPRNAGRQHPAVAARDGIPGRQQPRPSTGAARSTSGSRCATCPRWTWRFRTPSATRSPTRGAA